MYSAAEGTGRPFGVGQQIGVGPLAALTWVGHAGNQGAPLGNLGSYLAKQSTDSQIAQRRFGGAASFGEGEGAGISYDR